MRQQVIDFIRHHEESIDANEFSWLFAAAPSAGVWRHELMRVFMDAEIEPLRFMNKIPVKAFYQYPYSITIPENIEKIDMNAFEEAAFTEIVIPEGVEELSSAIFRNCQNLKRVTLPHSLNNVHGWIFFHCYNLEEILYNGTKDEFLHTPRIRLSCFIPEFSIDSYNFKIICTDGIIGLKDLLHYAK